jgi:hypothetical protein
MLSEQPNMKPILHYSPVVVLFRLMRNCLNFDLADESEIKDERIQSTESFNLRESWFRQ